MIDLSTLANVVTTLATMSKNAEEDQTPSNGDTGLGGDTSNNAAKAFDTLAKAVQPQVLIRNLHSKHKYLQVKYLFLKKIYVFHV